MKIYLRAARNRTFRGELYSPVVVYDGEIKRTSLPYGSTYGYARPDALDLARVAAFQEWECHRHATAYAIVIKNGQEIEAFLSDDYFDEKNIGGGKQ